MSTTKPKSTQWLRQRQLGRCQPQFQTTTELMQRLKLEKTLEGHRGCVNCLDWNSSGQLLASGSDDHDVIIWDPVRVASKNVIKTGHLGNIFSVKFMPNSSDHLIATSAADGHIKLTNTILNRTILNCKYCHEGRVKRLAVHPKEPNLILSAAEDGLIMQIDIREPHNCESSKANNILIDLTMLQPSLKAKCLALNPVREEMLAVGSNDFDVRIFDRRRLPTSNTNLSQSCIIYLSPGHVERTKQYRASIIDSFGATYLTFNSNGTELLVNMNRDQVHLYYINEPIEPYKSFEASAKKLICESAKSRNFNTTATTTGPSLKPTSDWDRLKKLNLQRNPMNIEQQTLYRQVMHKLTKDKPLSKLDFDHINELLTETRDCPELYQLRASALISRAWRGDEYQALRDTCCALVLNPSDLISLINLAVASVRLGDNSVIGKVLDVIEAKYGPEEYQKANNTISDMTCVKYSRITINRINNIDRMSNSSFSDEDMDATWIIDENEHQDETSSTPYLLSDLIPINETSSSMKQLSEAKDNKHSTKEIKSIHDYCKRYCGHCNIQTDMKEANFFGTNQEFIVAGSDDGAFYIWDKRTTNLVKACDGDLQILNCLQPHPTDCVLATSGIDPVVKLWSPNGSHCCDVKSLEQRCQQNQTFINSDPWDLMFSILYPDITRDA